MLPQRTQALHGLLDAECGLVVDLKPAVRADRSVVYEVSEDAHEIQMVQGA
jgi:hypothetical protein